MVAFLAALLLAGCGNDVAKTPDAGGSTSTSAGVPKGKPIKVGVVFDSGGRGDKSFNDSAWAGIERAEKELGVAATDVKPVESHSAKDFEPNLSSLADSGCDVVFAIGIGQDQALKIVAPKYPKVKFGLVDATVDQPNVRSIVFTEEQGSFLAGYAAALASKSGKVGFVGGKKIPLIEKFEAGFEAGAKTANPSVEVLPAKYTESWDDTALGKVMATTLFQGGADVVFHAAGRCGLGVIAAAKDTPDKLAIGVDSDQDDEAKGKVLTSMVKRVDQAVFSTIQDVKAGKFTGGKKVYDLKAGGVGLTDFRNTKDKIGPDGMKKLDEITKKIEDGSIKVPDKVADVPGYLATLKK